jgi:hypothetical protein
LNIPVELSIQFMKKFPNSLLILVLLLLSTPACNGGQADSPVVLANTPTTAASTPLPLTEQVLANLEYSGIYDQAVKLSAGEYTGPPFVEGGASRPTIALLTYAPGDLDQDGVSDAVVVLVENSGGSGNFIYMAAVLNESGIPVNTSTILLGDRVKVQSIRVVDGQIDVTVATHAPEDPLCCPTQQTEETYLLNNGQLIPLENK